MASDPQAAALLGPSLASHISLWPLTHLRASSLAASNCSGAHLKITDDSKFQHCRLAAPTLAPIMNRVLTLGTPMLRIDINRAYETKVIPGSRSKRLVLLLGTPTYSHSML